MLVLNYIEPFIFLFAFTNNLYMPTYKHMLFEVICTRDFNETIDNCNQNKDLNHEIETKSTDANMYLGIITIAPNLLLPLVMGHFGGIGKISLNRLISFPPLILLLQIMLSLAYSFANGFNLNALVIISGFIQFLGTHNVVKVMATLYISRTCSENRKTFRFLILEFMFLFSEVLGSLYVALFLDVVGPTVTLVLCAISMIVALFFLVNTSRRADSLTNNTLNSADEQHKGELLAENIIKLNQIKDEENECNIQQTCNKKMTLHTSSDRFSADKNESYDEINDEQSISTDSTSKDTTKNENLQSSLEDFENVDNNYKDGNKKSNSKNLKKKNNTISSSRKMTKENSNDPLIMRDMSKELLLAQNNKNENHELYINEDRINHDSNNNVLDSENCDINNENCELGTLELFKKEAVYFYNCCKNSFLYNKLVSSLLWLSAFGITFSEYGAYEIMVNYLLLAKFDFSSFHTGMIFTITSISKSTGSLLVIPLLLKVPFIKEYMLSVFAFVLALGYYILLGNGTNKYHIFTAPLFLILEPGLAAYNSKIIVSSYDSHLVGALLGLTNSASSIGMSLGIVLSNLVFSSTIKTYAGAVFFFNGVFFGMAAVSTCIAALRTINKKRRIDSKSEDSF